MGHGARFDVVQSRRRGLVIDFLKSHVGLALVVNRDRSSNLTKPRSCVYVLAGRQTDRQTDRHNLRADG